MPTLIVSEEGFRIVHTVVEGNDVYVMERRKADDAMGGEVWEYVKTSSTPILKMLADYITKKALETP